MVHRRLDLKSHVAMQFGAKRQLPTQMDITTFQMVALQTSRRICRSSRKTSVAESALCDSWEALGHHQSICDASKTTSKKVLDMKKKLGHNLQLSYFIFSPHKQVLFMFFILIF
uniref:Uncharacterized protein n=1 Tax=Caenorhabditis japonica TaxID=281687 RepID=A0A8R1IGF3_CAEJA